MSAESEVSSSRAGVPEPCLAARRGGQLEVVEDRDAGAVEPLQVEVPPVLVDALADRDRGDGERDVVSGRRQDIGGVEARRIAAPVGDDDALPGRDRVAGEDVQAWRTSPASGRSGVNGRRAGATTTALAASSATVIAVASTPR